VCSSSHQPPLSTRVRRLLLQTIGDKVKLDEFAAAVEAAKNLAETKHFQTVYMIDEADAKRAIGQPKPR
jgi:hypothetical protein